jgi:hypothetical protein
MSKRTPVRPARSKGLNFEYCECGCKSHVADAGPLSFRLYNDLQGNYTLYNSHGPFGSVIGRFRSFQAAENKATREARKTLLKMQKAVS